MSEPTSNCEPLIKAEENLPELTFKVIIISILLAAFLAASNAYLALKIGTTISASIPASVLAIGILRLFKNSNVLESNIIQTAASGGEGIAAAVAFIMPAMIIMHIWSSFHYWEVAIITALGGILGVLFSVPLRRVMLNMPSLPFPEGTAIGNVLRISQKTGAELGMLVKGSIVGAVISFLQSGLQLFSSTLPLWKFAFSAKTVLGLSLGFSPAPLAAGFIVGVRAGFSLLVGLLIGWVLLLPILAATIPHDHVSAYTLAMNLWSTKLRFVGVGVMLVGGVWTLLRLIKPVIEGMRFSFRTLVQAKKGVLVKVLRTEHDISIVWVLGGTGVIAVLLLGLLYHTMLSLHLPYSSHYLAGMSLVTVAYVIIIGFILATVCAYFTGLIGSTNNPLSGILILSLLILGVVFLLCFDPKVQDHAGSVAGLMILVTSVVATVASISNENLQDLRAGQMVGATPWKQQVILILGVVVSAVIVGPVLELLYQAYGIGGVFPHAGMNPAEMLAAPQAGLMAAVAKGLRSHQLDWSMIFIGCVVAVFCIIIDEILKRHDFCLPVLAVGLGIYLPPEITTPIIIGAYLSYFARKKLMKTPGVTANNVHDHQQCGVLLACGLVAGSAIMGVLLAIPFVIMGSADALSVVSANFLPIANGLGFISLVAVVVWIYRTGVRRIG